MKYTLRRCLRDDLPPLVKLCGSHASYERAVYVKTDKVTKLAEAILGADPKLHCWVVEVDGMLAGYFSYTFDFSTWDACTFMHLDCVYLEPAYRGLGIGKEIFQKLKEIAIENNRINIQWQTPDFNVHAIRFYEKLGAVSARKVRFYFSVETTQSV